MNKKKIKVPTAIPAQMFDFQVNASNHLTSAKLKVLHSDFTVDGRIFTKEMIEGIKNSIGGTPIVAHYDEESQDFIGHYSEQSVFGFVPEDAAVEIKSEDGREWLETEVKLFTRRHDVGRVAKQIIGKQQSLELDPSTTEFEVVLSDDPERKFDIVYKSGELIGLSVLGDYQSPAFSGSTFFEENEDEDDNIIKEIISKFSELPSEVEIDVPSDLFKDEEKNKGGEDEVILEDKEPVEPVEPEEPGKEPGETEEPEEPETETPEVPDEPEDPAEPDEDPLGDETVDVDADAGTDEVSDTDGTADLAESKEPVSDIADKEFTEDPSDNQPDKEESEGDEEVDETTETEATETEETAESQETGLESQTEETNADAFALNKEEREELENYRREHKIRIISEYKDFLPQESIDDFIERVDSFNLTDIEKELSFASMKFLKEKSDKTPTFMFGLPASNSKKSDDEVYNTIARYTNK